MKSVLVIIFPLLDQGYHWSRSRFFLSQTRQVRNR
jgi:hypothetical protein